MSNINFQHLERLTEALSKDLNSPGKNVSGKTLRIARDLFGNRDAWEAKQLKSHRDLLDDTKKQNIQALGLDLILKANREQDKPILRGILKVCNLFPKVFYSRNWKTTKETKISLGKALYLLGGGEYLTYLEDGEILSDLRAYGVTGAALKEIFAAADVETDLAKRLDLIKWGIKKDVLIRSLACQTAQDTDRNREIEMIKSWNDSQNTEDRQKKLFSDLNKNLPEISGFFQIAKLFPLNSWENLFEVFKELENLSPEGLKSAEALARGLDPGTYNEKLSRFKEQIAGLKKTS